MGRARHAATEIRTFTLTMLSPNTKSILRHILPSGLIFLLSALLYVTLERGLLGGSSYYPLTGNPYNPSRSNLIIPVMAFLTGLGLGALEVGYFSKAFAKSSFARKLLNKSLVYAVIILLFVVILSDVSTALTLHTGLLNRQVLHYIGTYVFSFAFLSTALYMGATIIVSQFYLEVSDNIGRAALVNFFTGRYHRPIEEERIYLFIDMRSSTTIAERLGHVRYFELLKEYYADLSPSIVKHHGEIYQYVGDEVVVTWKPRAGLKSAACIECFFAMKTALGKESGKFQERFGVVPDFKAGLHLGKVTTGEIGTVKREIIFTGDVLNTTARIQSLCNALGADLIVSDALLKRIDLPPAYLTVPLGDAELRGRDEKMELFAVRRR